MTSGPESNDYTALKTGAVQFESIDSTECGELAEKYGLKNATAKEVDSKLNLLFHNYLFSAVFNYNVDITENFTFFENSQIIGFVLDREINEEYIDSIVNLCDTSLKPYILEMNKEVLGAIKNV